MENKKYGIVILNFNGTNDTIECLESLSNLSMIESVSVYVLDNGSEMSEYSKLELAMCDYAFAELIRSEENLGFAKGNNQVVASIKDKHEWMVLLNNDTVVERDFISDMDDFISHQPTISFASCRINTYYDKRKLWNAGGKLTAFGNRRYYSERELDGYGQCILATFITGCALFVKTKLIEKDSLFTEDFFFGEEDYNFCMRMRNNGIKGACLNKILVYHKVSATSTRQSEEYVKTAIHFANRVVDMKSFYPSVIWKIWKKIYFVVLWVECFKWKYSSKQRRFIIDTVKKYSDGNAIGKKEYMEIRESASTTFV